MLDLCSEDVHVPTEIYLKVRQSSFGVHVPERADAVHDETIVLDGSLETLHTVP